uniref:Magnesium-protoporphyrin IX monomethyl ester [oxidative] cyclase n=1 Tax=Schizocladia ischiensis TaxID=196139 RepID=A0A7S6U9T9_9STRA|nr:acsF [Schizocladia ischiensis]QOW07467.1 acsF [Schizocladia ischiensis]
MDKSIKDNKSISVISKTPSKETLLTPRFYTTDFEAMANLDITSNEVEIRAINNEFQVDYNKNHFIRGSEFKQSYDFDEKTKGLFIEFLERSCTAEFSGFLLYKELSRNLEKKNPLLAEGFAFMSRDEARHAGFLNKAMSDFNVSLDLGFLTKSRKYTFFSPKFIFYATYLSEKIGYWRYITIYNHLNDNPEYCVYPIFRYFKRWCQDENRHGDFFAAVLKSQPHLLNNWVADLWCRFFLLSVFCTMYLNDLQRADFYKIIGLDARDFDKKVIEETNKISGRLFPVILDVNNPKFFDWLENCAEANFRLIEINNMKKSNFIKFLLKINHYLDLGINLINLYLLKPINTKAHWNDID